MSQNNNTNDADKQRPQRPTPYSNPLAGSSLFGRTPPPAPLPDIPASQPSSNPVSEESRILEKQNDDNKEIRQSERAERWNTTNPEKHHSTLVDMQQSGIPEQQIDEKPDKSRYGKAGYRLSPQSADQLEEMKLLLRRQVGRKVYYEEMVEEMIDQAYQEVKEKGQRSTLTRRLSRKPER